jgi:MFS family permease
VDEDAFGMLNFFVSGRFLLLAATNLCLFLIVATWSFLPFFIVSLGGSNLDVGLVMGSLGITSLGALPLIAPIMDRYGRKNFILWGILVIGLANGCFLFFDKYSHLMILVRLVQGLAFAACFNGCSTAIVDLCPPEKRVQGIGLFGVSGSIAVAIGPFLGEIVLFNWGFTAYFCLLMGFGLLGFAAASLVVEPTRKLKRSRMRGFFTTAVQDSHLPMMLIAAVCGAGFAAMNTFFPLHARSLGFKAGIFFISYGCSLIIVRVLLGHLADSMNREKLIFSCLIGFGLMLISTSRLGSLAQSVFLGGLFGIVQGLSYPAMMAKMLDRSTERNRAVVVALFTGSFGVGINASVLAWGFLANLYGLKTMFLLGGLVMFVCAVGCAGNLFSLKRDDAFAGSPVLNPKAPRTSLH